MSEQTYIPALRYNWLTRFYDTVLTITFPEKKIKQALIEQAKFTANEKVLDFGVGTATLSLMIKKQFPFLNITGIDVDKNILAIAAKKANTDVELVQYNGSHIPLHDAHIDKVVSSLVFHHIPTQNKKAVLKEIYRVLKPGGELHIADFGKARSIYAKVAFAIFRRLDGEENTRVNSRGQLPQFIEEAGFKNVEETKYFNTLFGTIKLIRAVRVPHIVYQK